MWRWTRGALTLFGLIGLVLSSLGANAAPLGGSNGHPSGGDSLSERLPLAADEAYLGQGAITNMPICLSVAGDPDADRLWNEEVPDHLKSPTSDKDELAVWLRTIDTSIDKEQKGFGIFLVCAQVVTAWHPAPFHEATEHSSDDGRVAHGVVVIDLALGENRRASIDPTALVRLLASPKLLPSATFGGLLIRNATIERTLLFYNVNLTIPLAFVNVTFSGNAYSKEVFEQDGKDNRSISVLHSNFSDHVTIINSDMCGHVRIYDSQFSENFEINKVTFSNCSINSDGEFPSIHIGSSNFDQSLKIIESQFNNFNATSNNISSFFVYDNDFGKELALLDNDFGTVQSKDRYLARNVSINYNRVEGDLFLQGNQGTTPPVEAISVSSNRIGGGFGFIGFGSVQALPNRLKFRSNHVGNGSEIELPSNWRGEVTLAGSTYNGTLTIGLINDGAADRTLHDPDLMNGRYCNPVQAQNEAFSGMVVDLTATDVGTLNWHMPLNCDHRWSGFGLAYRLWQPRSDLEKRREAAFRTWRTTLTYPKATSLDTMSRYLAGQGAYVASREIQVEANRLNYAPLCRPDYAWWWCLYVSLPELRPKRTAAAADTVTNGRIKQQDSKWNTIVQTATFLLLLPVGYGAAPERAIAWLIGGMVGFALIYWLYIRWTTKRCAVADARTRRVLERLTKHVAGQGNDTEALREMRSAVAKLSKLSLPNRLAVTRDLLPKIEKIAEDSAFEDHDLYRLQQIVSLSGTSEIVGFSRFDDGQMLPRFTPLRYSIDAMLPVIDLRAYSTHYPESSWIRTVSLIQHICGWWWINVFMVSAAIL